MRNENKKIKIVLSFRLEIKKNYLEQERRNYK